MTRFTITTDQKTGLAQMLTAYLGNFIGLCKCDVSNLYFSVNKTMKTIAVHCDKHRPDAADWQQVLAVKVLAGHRTAGRVSSKPRKDFDPGYKEMMNRAVHKILTQQDTKPTQEKNEKTTQ